MNYTTFFQTAISQHQTEVAAHRQRVLDHHARIMNLLAPLLRGLEQTFTGHVYQDHKAGQLIRGELALTQFTDTQVLQSAFFLECQGCTVLTIELNQSTVNLGNGLKSDKWYLREFDEQAVDLAARHISEWIVPRLVVACPEVPPELAEGLVEGACPDYSPERSERELVEGRKRNGPAGRHPLAQRSRTIGDRHYEQN